MGGPALTGSGGALTWLAEHAPGLRSVFGVTELIQAPATPVVQLVEATEAIEVAEGAATLAESGSPLGLLAQPWFWPVAGTAALFGGAIYLGRATAGPPIKGENAIDVRDPNSSSGWPHAAPASIKPKLLFKPPPLPLSENGWTLSQTDLQVPTPGLIGGRPPPVAALPFSKPLSDRVKADLENVRAELAAARRRGTPECSPEPNPREAQRHRQLARFSELLVNPPTSGAGVEELRQFMAERAAQLRQPVQGALRQQRPPSAWALRNAEFIEHALNRGPLPSKKLRDAIREQLGWEMKSIETRAARQSACPPVSLAQLRTREAQLESQRQLVGKPLEAVNSLDEAQELKQLLQDHHVRILEKELPRARGNALKGGILAEDFQKSVRILEATAEEFLGDMSRVEARIQVLRRSGGSL